jgi:hypothetical protein
MRRRLLSWKAEFFCHLVMMSGQDFGVSPKRMTIHFPVLKANGKSMASSIVIILLLFPTRVSFMDFTGDKSVVPPYDVFES